MKLKTIIFDFDGVIADTLENTINAFNKLSDKFDYKKVDKKYWAEWRHKTSREVIKDLEISFFKLPRITNEVRKQINRKIKEIESFKIKSVLTKLKKKGYGLVILSTNSEENIKTFLKINDLDLFDGIFSGSSLFGKSVFMKRVLKKLNLMAEEVVYIGDEVRDIRASKGAGIKIIAVSWGYNSRKILNKYNPDFLVDKPSELLRVIEFIEQKH